MKSLIFILLLIFAFNCYSQPSPPQQREASEPTGTSEPKRCLYMGIGILTGEVIYQTSYAFTKDHEKARLITFFGTMVCSFATAKIEQKVTGNEFNGCRFAAMSIGGGMNAIGHGMMEDNSFNHTIAINFGLTPRLPFSSKNKLKLAFNY